jgi:hypothetical protein
VDGRLNKLKSSARSATSGLPTPDAGRKSDKHSENHSIPSKGRCLQVVIQVQEDTSHENAMVWRKNENEA